MKSYYTRPINDNNRKLDNTRVNISNRSIICNIYNLKN